MYYLTQNPDKRRGLVGRLIAAVKLVTTPNLDRNPVKLVTTPNLDRNPVTHQTHEDSCHLDMVWLMKYYFTEKIKTTSVMVLFCTMHVD